ELDSLRRSLGLDQFESGRLVADMTGDAYVEMLRRVVQSGPPSPQELEDISHFKSALAVRSQELGGPLHGRLVNLLRELVTEAIQDERVDPTLEETLTWLQTEAGILESEVALDWVNLQGAKRLAAYREGKLPSVPTTKLLEGGETCHVEQECTFRYRTKTKLVILHGELVVTSKRIIFMSPERNFKFSPSK